MNPWYTDSAWCLHHAYLLRCTPLWRNLAEYLECRVHSHHSHHHPKKKKKKLTQQLITLKLIKKRKGKKTCHAIACSTGSAVGKNVFSVLITVIQ